MAKRRKPLTTIEPGIQRLDRARGPVFRVQLAAHGRRASIICRTYAEAQQVKADWLAHGLPAAGAPAGPAPAPRADTLDDAIDQHVHDLRELGKETHRAEQVQRWIAQYQPGLAALPAREMTPADIRQFWLARHAMGKKDSTIERDAGVLVSAIRKVNPTFRLPVGLVPPSPPRFRDLTPDQQAKVFPCLAHMFGAHFAAMALLAMVAVLRIGEIRGMRRDHVQLELGVLVIPKPKNKRPRIVRLSPEATLILTWALAQHPHEHIFGDPRTGQPYSRVHISRVWRASTRACGIRDFTFHDLRKVAPSRAISTGVPEANIQAAGGWLTAHAMRVYAHALGPAIRAATTVMGEALALPVGDVLPFPSPANP
jgi:integrase